MHFSFSFKDISWGIFVIVPFGKRGRNRGDLFGPTFGGGIALDVYVLLGQASSRLKGAYVSGEHSGIKPCGN